MDLKLLLTAANAMKAATEISALVIFFWICGVGDIVATWGIDNETSKMISELIKSLSLKYDFNLLALIERGD